jgi:two-component system OmpR family sensor kinase
MLILAILSTGLIASLASFYFSYSQAEEFQDDALRQIAAQSLSEPHGQVSATTANQSVEDPESRIMIIRLPNDPRPAWMPQALANGLHTLEKPDGSVRVFVRSTRAGGHLAVVQPTDARDEIAFDSASRTLIPIFRLLAMLILRVVRIVRQKLAVLLELATRLDRQAAGELQPIPYDTLPDEIAPFVRAINGLLGRVGQLVTVQGRFVADAAHELRSPLTALSLQVQNVGNAETLGDARARLQTVKAGVERARRLAEQLLNLARVQSQSLSMERLDLSRLARDVMADFLPLADAKQIDLGLEESGTIEITTHAPTLRAILTNALDNALRYTPSGGRVTVRLAVDDQDIWLEVTDTGPGISADEMAKVFEPFYRSAQASGQGSGLGLAIAKDAAKRLGGIVSVESVSEGPGLSFRYRQGRNKA